MRPGRADTRSMEVPPAHRRPASFVRFPPPVKGTSMCGQDIETRPPRSGALSPAHRGPPREGPWPEVRETAAASAFDSEVRVDRFRSIGSVVMLLLIGLVIQ